MKARYLSFTFVLILLSGCQKSVSIQYIDPEDPLTGWFKVEKSAEKSAEFIVPVFKIDGTYYSVCRGFEIPFHRTPAGLEWGMKSSMSGTTIGYRPDGSAFIIVRDAQSEMFTSESESPHDTGPRLMVRIDRPSGLPQPTVSAPKSNDDFTGCYRPVYFPYVNIEIRNEGGRYFHAAQQLGQTIYREPKLLTPLADQLGFTCLDRKCENTLTYNKSLNRYEFTMKNTSPPLIMPLVKISKPTCEGNIITESDFSPGFVPIGIPSWH